MPRSRGGRPASRPMGRTSSPPPSTAPPSNARGYSTTTSSQPSAPPSAPPPAPAHGYAPQPAASGGMMSGIMGTVAQGMALGTGSAIGHRAVDAAFGTMFGGSEAAPPAHVEPAQVQQGAAQLQQAQHPCAGSAQAFADCMSKNGGDMGACDFFYQSMQQCKLQNP